MSYADELAAIDQEMVNRSQGMFGTTVSLTPEQQRLKEEQLAQEEARQQELQRQQFEQKRAGLLQKYQSVETYPQWQNEMYARNAAIDEINRRKEMERAAQLEQMRQLRQKTALGDMKLQGLATGGAPGNKELTQEYIKGLNQQIVELQKSKADAVSEEELKKIDDKITVLDAQRKSLLGIKEKPVSKNTGQGLVRSGKDIFILTPGGPKKTTLPELKKELKIRVVQAIKTGNKNVIPSMMKSLKKNLPADVYENLSAYKDSIMPKEQPKVTIKKNKPSLSQVVRKPIPKKPKKKKPAYGGSKIYKEKIMKAKPWEAVTPNERKVFNAIKMPFRMFKLMYRSMNAKFYSDLIKKAKSGTVKLTKKDLKDLPDNVKKQLMPYVR